MSVIYLFLYSLFVWYSNNLHCVVISPALSSNVRRNKGWERVVAYIAEA